jgi:hypothetical protein
LERGTETATAAQDANGRARKDGVTALERRRMEFGLWASSVIGLVLGARGVVFGEPPEGGTSNKCFVRFGSFIVKIVGLLTRGPDRLKPGQRTKIDFVAEGLWRVSRKGEHPCDSVVHSSAAIGRRHPGGPSDLSQSILVPGRETDFSQFRTVRVQNRTN